MSQTSAIAKSSAIRLQSVCHQNKRYIVNTCQFAIFANYYVAVPKEGLSPYFCYIS